MILYAIAAVGTDFVKVGRTDGTLQRRVANLQIGSPHRLRPVWAARCDHKGCERRMHRSLVTRHTLGEWFDFTGADAVGEVRRLSAEIGGHDELSDVELRTYPPGRRSATNHRGGTPVGFTAHGLELLGRR